MVEGYTPNLAALCRLRPAGRLARPKRHGGQSDPAAVVLPAPRNLNARCQPQAEDALQPRNAHDGRRSGPRKSRTPELQWLQVNPKLISLVMSGPLLVPGCQTLVSGTLTLTSAPVAHESPVPLGPP